MRYDSARRRKVRRTGREKGVWVYVPQVELESAGLRPEDVKGYRVWAGPRGTVAVSFYKDAD